MWFIETPWPPIAICLAVAVGLFFHWTTNQKPKIYLYSSLGLVAISLGIFFVEREIVTDNEIVEESLIAMTTAFKNDDSKKVLSFISDDGENFLGGILLKPTVSGAMLRYRVDSYLRISDVSVREGEDGKLISRFRANGTVVQKFGSSGGHLSSLWELTWKKNESSGLWLIVKIQRYSPLSEEPIEIMERTLN